MSVDDKKSEIGDVQVGTGGTKPLQESPWAHASFVNAGQQKFYMSLVLVSRVQSRESQ